MGKHYVTFGQIHVHSVNGKTFDKDCVAVIKSATFAEGRALAFEYFGDKFGTSYQDNQWDESDLEFYPRGYINVSDGL